MNCETIFSLVVVVVFTLLSLGAIVFAFSVWILIRRGVFAGKKINLIPEHRTERGHVPPRDLPIPKKRD
ncbi:hypothetical protein SAMN06296273_1191 [Nitrosomonas ureae]|uniref:Uncharacterized protein n=1 Tax=Nitrosomonas ureae TaxID=44577 RepID=A0A285BWT9_9PROT|nr:hypothetical protein SAMN06296273_1191 [Nitrosomonas ureae]